MSHPGLKELNFALLGAGSMGRAFATALADSAAIRELCVWSRDAERAAELCDSLADSKLRVESEPELERALSCSDVVVFCVPDDALESLAQRASASSAAHQSSGVALHLSGCASPEVLSSLQPAGWSVGSCHPLVSIPRTLEDGDPQSNQFSGVAFAIDGDDAALQIAESLASVLHGFAMKLDADEHARALYHGAASLLSGGLVTLFDCAERMFAGSVAADPSLSREALLELLRSTVRNLENGTATECLTGPVVRGDRETLNGHLKALSTASALRPKSADQLYRELSRAMLELAQRRGTLSAEQIVSMQALLEGDSAIDPN